VNTVVAITAVVGILAAFVGRAVMPGRQILGAVGTAVAGAVGGVGAAYGGQAAQLFRLGDPLAFVAAVLGGVIALAIVSRIFR
jgi:uncharacterized membrane protein YeaQ/YmgE (transglycosylase-associated protein family)